MGVLSNLVNLSKVNKFFAVLLYHGIQPCFINQRNEVSHGAKEKQLLHKKVEPWMQLSQFYFSFSNNCSKEIWYPISNGSCGYCFCTLHWYISVYHGCSARCVSDAIVEWMGSSWLESYPVVSEHLLNLLPWFIAVCDILLCFSQT